MDPDNFFEQLGAFTDAWVRKYIKEGSGGLICPETKPRGDTSWVRGAVIHYTADMDPVRVMRWFLVRRYRSRVSAHAVVLPGWTGELRELASQWPLLGELSAPILLPVPLDQEAAHATWANSWAIGIENINIGWVEQVGEEFRTWRWRVGDREGSLGLWDVADGEPVKLFGRWRVPYSQAQVMANIEFLLALRVACEDRLEANRVVGHDQVQANKDDPGPAYPIHAVRSAVFEDQWEELEYSKMDPWYGRGWRDQIVEAWADTGDLKKAWFDFAEAVAYEGRRARPGWNHWLLGTLILELLGYGIREGDGTGDTSIRIFQTSAGAAADGIIGPITWRALVDRARLRGILPGSRSQS